jgi:uncharacterized NAD(P)/FAD-binding protein YdhS
MKKKISRIAIAGLGPSGIATYVELIRRFHPCLDEVVLFDGLGVANGSAFASELEGTITNTSVGVTSITATDSLDLFRWLRHRHPERGATPQSFIPRRLVRDYCRDRLNESILFAREFGCVTRIVQRHVAGFERNGDGVAVVDGEGQRHAVDVLVLATGGSYGQWQGDLAGAPGFVANPYPESRFLARIGSGSRVLILGSKLSAIDAAIAVAGHAPGAGITMASPSGMLPSVRNELLVKPTPQFQAHAVIGLPQRTIPRAVFVGAARTLKALARQGGRENGRYVPLDQLRREIDDCRAGLNTWQFAIADFVDQVNEIWPSLSDAQKVVFKKRNKLFIDRYVSSFPLQNAEKILALMENRTLDVVRTGAEPCVRRGGDAFEGCGALAGRQFDVVVNATGLGAHNPVQGFAASLDACGAAFNRHGGVCVDTGTMRVRGGGGDLPVYAVGGPVAGELLVINYIRSSAIQAMKIAKDLGRLIDRDPVRDGAQAPDLALQQG